MSNKKSFDEKLNNFFAGKGFYIVLVLCVAVIGVSAYFLLTDRGTDVDDKSLSNAIAPRVSTAPVTPLPTPDELPNDDPEQPTDSQQEDVVSEETEVWTEQETEAAANAQFIWPLEGEIILPYSMASLIYNDTMGDWRTHDGVDLTAALGTQVLAVCGGKVESVTMDDLGGMTVVIAHAGGLRSIYSNLAAVPTVYEGDNVMTGEVIGSLGTTAPGQNQENPRLCLRMTLDGQSVDPSEYLPVR